MTCPACGSQARRHTVLGEACLNRTNPRRHGKLYLPERKARKVDAEHLNHLPYGQGYRRGCRCTHCVEVYRDKKRAERERRLAKPIPADVHGTWNGYANYNCRCEDCLQASREYTGEYAAQYRDLHREEKNAHRREYYYRVKAAEEEQDLQRKRKK